MKRWAPFIARYPWVGPFLVGIFFCLIVCAVWFVTVVVNQRQVENLGRVAPPSVGFATSEGWFLTPGQHASAIALSDDPRLASAERYLLDQGGFKGGVRINLDSCRAGLMGTHWDRDYRSIVNCFSPLSAFHTALQNRHEPDAGRITQNAALFVLLHEIGHSFLADRKVPFLGREEDAADEIAALLAIDRHFPDIIDAGAQFFEIEATNGGASDDHSDPARRAYRVRCLAYGSDPQRFASWSRQKPRKADDQSCRLLYQAQHANWIQILRYAKARDVPQKY